MLLRKPRNFAVLAILSALGLSTVVVLDGIATLAHGKSKGVKKRALSQAPAAKTLWDEWYTVTVSGKIHYGYYNERVELRGARVFLKNEFWKQEEDYINRENLGVVAENNDDLTPLFFNFHSVYRTTETTIDATVKDGKFFSARARRSGKDLPVVQRTLPSKVFFSSLFSVWMGKRLASAHEGQELSFSTIMEDQIAQGFQVMDGRVKLEKPDDYAKASGTRLLRVDSRGIRTLWWVDDKGVAQRIEMPEQKIRVERAPKEKAKKFLDGTI